MRVRWSACLVSFYLGSAFLFSSTGVHAQRRISLKSGESVELSLAYSIRNCKSVLIGNPEVEVLEGPEELTLAIKPGNVIPRGTNCSNQVPGGTVVATAKDIKAPKESKLTYRVKYHTLEGDRQTSRVYLVSLFP
jgi:hypothetical protein